MIISWQNNVDTSEKANQNKPIAVLNYTCHFFRFVYRNIIDVAAMDSHNLEPQELNDRIRLYSHKLSQQWGTLQEDTTSVANGTQTIMLSIFFFVSILEISIEPSKIERKKFSIKR